MGQIRDINAATLINPAGMPLRPTIDSVQSAVMDFAAKGDTRVDFDSLLLGKRSGKQHDVNRGVLNVFLFRFWQFKLAFGNIRLLYLSSEIDEELRQSCCTC